MKKYRVIKKKNANVYVSRGTTVRAHTSIRHFVECTVLHLEQLFTRAVHSLTNLPNKFRIIKVRRALKDEGPVRTSVLKTDVYRIRIESISR